MRVKERFWEFSRIENRYGHTFPEGSDVRKICINFHSKGGFFRNFPLLHAPFCGQVLAEYVGICWNQLQLGFLDQFESKMDSNTIYYFEFQTWHLDLQKA